MTARAWFLSGAALAGVACLAASARSSRAAFPGTSGRIVFDISGDANPQVFAMNADGSGRVQLTNDMAGGYFASGSADGRQIAFTRCAADCEIYVMNADGTEPRNVTNNSATDVRPAWSPDGRKIAFTSLGRGGSWEVMVMNADGSAQTKLTNNPAIDGSPVWSPDGKKIAFDRIGSGPQTTFEVLVVNADGSGETNLTPAPDNGLAPDWSPDGAKIVYTEAVPFPAGSNLQGAQPDVFVMNADGSAKTNLTNSQSVVESDPVWSPDGTKIVYAGQPLAVGSNKDIWVMNADGSGQTNLTADPPFEGAPDWMPVPVTQPPPPPPPPPAQQACHVPKVIGLRLAGAKQRIRRARCAVGRVRKKRTKRVGRVLAQSPRPGTRLPTGGRVSLVVGRR